MARKKFVCPCGHPLCLKCVRLAWTTKLSGESIRCCKCERANPLYFLAVPIRTAKAPDNQTAFDWDKIGN
jgi:hypothetical protein